MTKGKIEIIGLGAGDIEQLPLGVYRKLISKQEIYLRTKEHPVVENLINENVLFHTFDDYYEKHDQFSDVYEEICQTLLEKAKEKEIIYAVPGHPMVAEKTVQLLLERGEQYGIEISIIGGQSFLDSLFQAIRVDPIEGFQLLDGTSFHQDELQLKQHMIIAQVYDAFVASNVKLSLMEKLPDDYEVYIVTAAGSEAETIKKVPLYELDRVVTLNNLTTIYVPPVAEERILYKQFTMLREIIATLRGPNGCPWDKKQTHRTLKKYLIEETYELLEAIEEDDTDHLIEELGDVLLQVMLHAQIGEDDGYFNIDDVIEQLSEKMIRRHPHVFGNGHVENEHDVMKTWEQIKNEEKRDNHQQSQLSGINKEAPNLLQAVEIQKKAAKVGFDWDDMLPALEKVKEEWREFQTELNNDSGLDDENLQKEFGDMLFALANVARFLKINPEEALFQTNLKFMKRFAYIEEQVKRQQRPFDDYTLEELDSFWEEAKKKGL